ncbi:MAG TPA: Maf family protein [Myxococcales bacterium]
MRIVLASASPRRREFFERLGLRFETTVPRIDEAVRPGEEARAYVERLAREKAEACARPGAVAVGADTTVVVRGEVLGKPRDRADAAQMLRMLSGGWHEVLTAVCVGSEVRCVVTRVKFVAMTEAQIEWLVRSGDGDDKAGAYGLQGLAGAFVERIEGSVSNVVGLPLAETLELLAKAGAELPWV